MGFYPDVNPKDYIDDALDASISAPTNGQIELVKYTQYTEVPTVVSSKIYFEENFDYGSTEGDLDVITTEWTVHSGSTDPVGYIATSLSMTGYPSTGTGGAITIATKGYKDVNSVFDPVSTGKVYGSALINLIAVSDGTYFFHFMDAEFGYSGRVGAKDDGSGKILFGIGAS